MPLDAICMTALTAELRETLTGGKVDKIYQPAREEALLHMRTGHGNGKLLLSASPAHPRAQFTAEPVLQFRSETQRPFFKATYLFGYQNVSATETAGRRTQPKQTDDKNTLVLRHVVVRPDGYYRSEDKPLVLTRIDE